MGSDDTSNVTYPSGSIFIDPSSRSISGHNPERQDFIIGPNAAPSFAGYFYARFSQPFSFWGTASNVTLHPNRTAHSVDPILSGFVQFANGTQEVEIRVGVSFISIEQAQKNLENETPDGVRLEDTAFMTRSAWKEKLEMIKLEGATEVNKTTFYTAFYHTLQVSLSSQSIGPPSESTNYSIRMNKTRMECITRVTTTKCTKVCRIQVILYGLVFHSLSCRLGTFRRDLVVNMRTN